VARTARVLTITIPCVNRTAIVNRSNPTAVTEASGLSLHEALTITATSTLTDTDMDNAANTFTLVNTATASDNAYGTYTMTTDGVGTYTLGNNNATVQVPNNGVTLNETFTVTTAEGTAQVATITNPG